MGVAILGSGKGPSGKGMFQLWIPPGLAPAYVLRAKGLQSVGTAQEAESRCPGWSLFSACFQDSKDIKRGFPTRASNAALGGQRLSSGPCHGSPVCVQLMPTVSGFQQS